MTVNVNTGFLNDATSQLYAPSVLRKLTTIVPQGPLTSPLPGGPLRVGQPYIKAILNATWEVPIIWARRAGVWRQTLSVWRNNNGTWTQLS